MAHFGKFYRICNDSLIYKEFDAYVGFYKKEYKKELSYHKLANHLNAVRDSRNIFDNIIIRSKDDEFPCMGKDIENINPCPNQ